MEEDKWVYEIGKDGFAVVFPLIGLVISGGIAVALALANNPAVFFMSLFALFMLVMTLMVLYRQFIMKFLVGKNGFYHKTRPGNGRYHRYSELDKAWTAFGGGTNALYFYYQLPGQSPVRFYYNPMDDEAVEYMLSKFRSFHPELEEENEDWDYEE